MSKEEELLAELYAWQEFIQHPCWPRWVASLAEDKWAADERLHITDARLTVEIAVAQTQYHAISCFMDYPQERILALTKALEKLNKREAK